MSEEIKSTTTQSAAVDPASALLAALDWQIDAARARQFNLTRDAEIATVKNQIVGEYRVRFMELRDKLRATISSGNDEMTSTPPKGSTL